jgi:hypothetical protein
MAILERFSPLPDSGQNVNPTHRQDRLMPSPDRVSFFQPAGILFLTGLVMLASGGCDRPFVDVAVPTIEVISPDPGMVQEEASINLTVSANSFRDVSRVEIGGHPFGQTGPDEWATEIELRPGLNRLIVEAFDTDEVAGIDTLHYLYVIPRVQVAAAPWSEARGGHTATLLPLGQVLIAGGAASITGPASNQLMIMENGSTRIRRAPADLRFARVGHSATLLPDGRVLLIGGSEEAFLDETGDLVEAPEIYDPVTEETAEIFVTGNPIRRAFHTTSLRTSGGALVVDVLGGTGDVTYNPVSELGIRRDLRSFLLRGDTLHALSPAIGPFVELLTGHSQTNLSRQPPGTLTRQLVTGAIFVDSRVETHHFILDPRSPLGIMFEDVVPPRTLRTEHAAVLMAPQRVLRLGGLTGSVDPPSATADIFEEAAGRFFDFPKTGLLRAAARHLHSATIMIDGRILVIGGFDSTGSAIQTIEIINFVQ